jgi:hypothetical protein
MLWCATGGPGGNRNGMMPGGGSMGGGNPGGMGGGGDGVGESIVLEEEFDENYEPKEHEVLRPTYIHGLHGSCRYCSNTRCPYLT